MNINFSSLPPTSYVTYMLFIGMTVFEVTVEPDSMLIAMTKVLALLGIMKLFSVVNAFHGW